MDERLTEEELAEIAANTEAAAESWYPDFGEEIWHHQSITERELHFTYSASLPPIPEETLRLLQAADHPYVSGPPEDFDDEEYSARIKRLIPTLEAIIDQRFAPPFGELDATWDSEICIYRKSNLPFCHDIVIALRFSNFGDLFTIYEHWHSRKENPITPAQLEQIIAVTEAAGFHYVELDSVRQPYAGRHPGFRHSTWSGRFFGIGSDTEFVTPCKERTDPLPPPYSSDTMSAQDEWDLLPQRITHSLNRFGPPPNRPKSAFISEEDRLIWLKELVEKPSVRDALSEYFPLLHLDYFLHLILPSDKGIAGNQYFEVYPIAKDTFRLTFWWANHVRMDVGETNADELPEIILSAVPHHQRD